MGMFNFFLVFFTLMMAYVAATNSIMYTPPQNTFSLGWLSKVAGGYWNLFSFNKDSIAGRTLVFNIF
jgi:hypothetical protein